MRKFQVTGMSCAACSTRVEKTVGALEGIRSCSVNLLTNSMVVEGDTPEPVIVAAVEKAGYGAKEIFEAKTDLKGDQQDRLGQEAGDAAFEESKRMERMQKEETTRLKSRLIASLCLLLPLMYLSMGHSMWGWPLPKALSDNYVGLGLLQLSLTSIVLLINRKFFINGFRGLRHGAPNMDTLVALGAGASFLYSFFVLFAMTDALSRGDHSALHAHMHDFYFESAAMIVTLITVGKLLESVSKGRTTSALKGLLDLAPRMAVVIREGKEEEIPAAQVRIGDVFVLRPGAAVPVDGIVLEGVSSVDESALTGESVPSDKEKGAPVWAATVNQYGHLTCEATKVGSDTVLSRIIKMVEDASATKAPIAKLADRVSGVFVPAVMGIALVTFLVWLLVGVDFGFALSMGISVLVISCPCALGLATPVAIMVGSGVGARRGILFKTAASLEQAGKTKTVILDKTGTITKGEPHVTAVCPAPGVDEIQFARAVLSLEEKSEHPLGGACVIWARERLSRVGQGGQAREVPLTDFEAVAGKGLRAKMDGHWLVGGSLSYMEGQAAIPEAARSGAVARQSRGETPLLFGYDNAYLGTLFVADVIKEDSPQAIRKLKELGMKVVMLTGDNRRTAMAVAEMAGVDEVISDVLPDEKEKEVRKWQDKGSVAMVGDGINDAPALTRANTGIAIGAGADIAIDAADVVLSGSRLSDVVDAIRLGRQTLRNIKENLFWAFIYNVIGIPLAAGVWYPVFGWKLNPMFGAAAMSLSSVCVVTNALRLNFFRSTAPDSDAGGGQEKEQGEAVFDEKIPDAMQADGWNETEGAGRTTAKTTTVKTEKVKGKEGHTMKQTMKIEGMMCGHCEATVKKALEALPEVEKAEVSHEAGEAVVYFAEGKEPTKDVLDRLRTAVEDKDYKVLSVDR